MQRLDKFLCDRNIGSRSQVKGCIRQGMVKVNGETVCRPEAKIEEEQDRVEYCGEVLKYQKHAYYMLNKPAGVVSATRDRSCQTVTDLLKETGHVDLFPAGRLDKDTEGLLLMTNDGELAHRLLSPRKHVEKVYYCELELPLSEQDISRLEEGVDIGEGRLTQPAKVEKTGERSIHLAITEGKFHQVKRMLLAVGNRVSYLKRIAMGSLVLDEGLKPGDWRELTEEEIKSLKG
ncbi:MAG: rRNA pseudouridine synthase [Lachnospiraceae bacterium]|nr:rRNA pseudouridine synthase [Lachnospiraceae bacterium]